MNKDQILSIVRTVLKTAGAALVTKGVISDTGLESVIGGLITIIGIVWSHYDNSAPTDKPPSSGSSGAASLIVLCAILGVFGAGLTGCASMDASGPYKGDKALYVADLTITTSYTVLEKFVTFEYQNREALAGQPAIKAMADKIRINAPTWFQNAEIARDAYAAHPVSANLTALQNSIQVIQAAIQAASAYMIANPQLLK